MGDREAISGDPPAHCPHATPADIVARLFKLSEKFPHFALKKLKARLTMEEPLLNVPSASTIGDILKREGLILHPNAVVGAIAQGEIEVGAKEPSGEWCYDFKGWFRVRDRTRCNPLTLTDTANCYLIEVRICASTHDGVKAETSQPVAVIW